MGGFLYNNVLQNLGVDGYQGGPVQLLAPDRIYFFMIRPWLLYFDDRNLLDSSRHPCRHAP